MQNGFAIIHANHLETLLAVLQQRCAAEPLAPLEEEIILVQSNGMADWLKLKLADATGISMSLRFPMPASFLWELYRQVLAPEALEQASPFAKDSLQWRLLRLLPGLLDQPGFERPAGFLADDRQGMRLFQLAQKLADLFDQYQLYRADWLLAWEKGQTKNLGQDEHWQAALWRALLTDMPPGDRQHSRAHLHAAFKHALQQGRPARLPRRIFLFGVNSLPAQLLEALYALAPYCQLLLLVLNPSRELWDARSQPEHANSHPLLDQWGGLGRDFQALLLEYEPAPALRLHATEHRVFDDATGKQTLPLRIQQALLDNLPLPDRSQRQPLPADPGLSFFPAWSRQREVEVLHDRLLDLFAQDRTLRYTDVVVMMPDVDSYSAHIEAVFNRYAAEDPRHLDFAISDRHASADQPLFQAVSWLLELPNKRITQSEVLFLLGVPALRNAFGLGAPDLDLIRRWLDQSHIRWGFDGAHKQAAFQLPALPANTWRAGLDQLLAGYCAGAADLWEGAAVDEVSANQGEVLGRLCHLLDTLEKLQQSLQQKLPPVADGDDWRQLFGDLLQRCFRPTDDSERNLLALLEDALGAWLDDCALAAFNAPLPLAQARSGWLDKVRSQGLSQQLAFHGITFCTLMPMRALPFRHVFLLGMNDGDYPREQLAPDFDLMHERRNYRAGDRNRRDDDQYLFLEALLSVRDSLHISWIGKNILNKREEPASVLVEQLKDLVDACWLPTSGQYQKASDELTLDFPLAAFSRRYFEQDTNLRTHAGEWFPLHPAHPAGTSVFPAAPAPETLELWQLVTFFKQPADTFFAERLQTRFQDAAEAVADAEPFRLDHLAEWQLRHTLLTTDAPAEKIGHQWLASGSLPAGHFAERIFAEQHTRADNIRARFDQHRQAAQALEPVSLHIPLADGTLLAASVGELWQTASGWQRLLATASNLKADKKAWRVEKLADFWLRHLALAAAGHAVTSQLVSLDTQVALSPLPQAEAAHLLDALAECHRQALGRPLPIAAQAAFAWLERAGRHEAEKAFTDKDLTRPAVQRSFDSFDDLWPADTDGQAFTHLACEIYGPLWQALGGELP